MLVILAGDSGVYVGNIKDLSCVGTDGRVEVTASRRTFGYKRPSRRTFGRYKTSSSRRTFGFSRP